MLETIVQFAPVSYGVEEGEAAELIVVLSNPSDSVVMVTLQTFDVTAMGEISHADKGYTCRQSENYIRSI